MSSRGVYQIFRWTARNVSPSVFSPFPFRRCQLPSMCVYSRLYCSSSDQMTSQHSSELTPSSRQPVSRLSLPSLIDMGFTDSQAEQIIETVSRVGGGGAAKHTLSALTVLFGLGLNSSSVLKMLDKYPEICIVTEKQLMQRISNLRKLGFGEGSLQRMVVHYPKILAVPVKSVNNVALFLRENCLFTVQQITDILRDSPAVVVEDLGQLEYKFQYVYYRMGVKQTEMVKCRLFRFTLDEVRCRHSFLERRGLYQTPDKKGQTTIVNPKLDSILNVELDTFITHVAQASAEEYNVFEKLLAREWREEEFQQGRIEVDSDDDEADEEEEEETEGKSGYRKKKKNK
ncbi:transcription termination factor 4, mitochondrial [Melanotaenia boesemani]|uniref:transcription termination factor 4, mitochondrial n=1 Tax=Melanotaenia boesemani TaxID=1250792 RepID=UPI001C04FD7E|nr:transcription termination factor 4, mitochondrial [Melanotaenia boesemani]